MLKPLAWQGDLCYGPSRGNKVTFRRPEDASRGVDRPAADRRSRARPRSRRTSVRTGRHTIDAFRRWLGAGSAADPAAGEGARPAPRRGRGGRRAGVRPRQARRELASAQPAAASGSWAASMPTCSARAPPTGTSFPRPGGPRSAVRLAGSHRSWSGRRRLRHVAPRWRPGAGRLVPGGRSRAGPTLDEEVARLSAILDGRSARWSATILIVGSELPARSDVHTGPQPGTGVEARGSGGRRSLRAQCTSLAHRAPRHGCGYRGRDRNRS